MNASLYDHERTQRDDGGEGRLGVEQPTFSSLSLLTVFSLLLISVSSASSVGAEYNSSSNVWHLWNDVFPYDYYVNSTSGLQLANNLDAPWESVALCPYAMSGSTKATYCTDSLPFAWKAVTDNSTYVNLTGTYSLVTTSSFKPQFNFTYNLKLKEPFIHRLFITRNLGTSSSAGNVGVVWVSKKIKIGGTGYNDSFGADAEYYPLNSIISFSNSSLAVKEYWLADWGTGENIRVAWNSKNYTLNASSNGTQSNATVLLDQPVGTLGAGQTLVAENTWVDAICNWVTCRQTFPSSNTAKTLLQTYSAEGYFDGISGTCPSTGTVETQFNWTVDSGGNNTFNKINSSTTMGLSIGTLISNPQTVGIDGEMPDQSQPADWLSVQANIVGNYETRMKCTFNSQVKYSANGGSINVTQLPLANCTNFIPLTADTTLTANNNSCFNITTSNVKLDCANYVLGGNQPHGFFAVNITNANNVTIQNCYFKNWTNGILLNSSNNSQLINNTFWNFSDYHWQTLYSEGVDAYNTWNLSLQSQNFSKFTTAASQTTTCTTNPILRALSIDSNSGNVTIHNSTFFKIAGTYTADGDDVAGCQPTTSAIGSGMVSSGKNVSVYNSSFSAITLVSVSQTTNPYFNLTSCYLNGSSASIESDNATMVQNTLNNSRFTLGTANNNYVYNNSFANGSGNTACISSLQNGINLTMDGNLFRHCMGVSNQWLSSVIKNNVYRDVKSTTSTANGVFTQRSGDNSNVSNETFYNITGGNGLFYVVGTANGADNTNFTNINITNISSAIALYHYLAANVPSYYYNSYIENSSRPTIYSVISLTELHNTTFKGRLEFYANGSGDLLNVYEYARVNVTNSSLVPIPNALVNVTDARFNKTLLNNLTDANGLTPWTEVFLFNQTGNATEACSDQTYKWCNTPHNVSVNKTGFIGNTTNFTLTTLVYNPIWLEILPFPIGVPSSVNVTLVAPENGNLTKNGTMNFSCNVTSSITLNNLSLYLNYSGSWAVNQTVSVNGLTNATNFTVSNLPDGNQSWNCRAWDINGGNNYSVQNWTVNVSRPINPFITLELPPDYTLSSVSTQQFTCNATANYNLQNVSLYLNYSGWAINQTLDAINAVSNQSNFTVDNLPNANISWNCRYWTVDGLNAFAAKNYSLNVSVPIPTPTPTVTGNAINVSATIQYSAARWRKLDDEGKPINEEDVIGFFVGFILVFVLVFLATRRRPPRLEPSQQTR